METSEILILLLFVGISGLLAAVWWKLSNLEKKAAQPGDLQGLTLIQQQMAQLQTEVSGRLKETNQRIITGTNLVKLFTRNVCYSDYGDL